MRRRERRPGRGLVVAVLAALAASGCAGFGDRYPDATEARIEGREAEMPGYTYGHGTGETPEAARHSALQEIAGEVVTAVRSEQREVFRSLRRRGELPDDEAELATELELTATVASVAHVELEGAELDAERRISGGWYVRMRMPARRMEMLRDQARRNAPALAQFEVVDGVPQGEPGRRFRLAVRGLDTAERTGVADRRLYTPEIGETTFGAYFEETARRAAARLQVIPLVDGDSVRFAVVDRETLQPQPRLAIRVGHRELTANSDGVTASRRTTDLSSATRVVVVGDPGTAPPIPESARVVETLYPEDWSESGRATLYVHTAPPEAIIEVTALDRSGGARAGGGVEVVGGGRQYSTPARVPVRPGREYALHVFGTEEYRGHTERVTIPARGPAAYRSVTLTERRYGYIDLTAEGRHSRIRLDGPVELQAGAFDQILETGRYEVRVDRGGDRRYQEIVDELVLRRDETVRRRYAEPIDRQPYHYGWRWALSLFYVGGEPADDYLVPWYGGDTAYADLEDAPEAQAAGVRGVSRDGFNALFGVQGQYFANTLPLTVAGSFALRMEQFDIDYEDSVGGRRTVEEDLVTTQTTVGVGVWRPLGGGGAIGWLTANRAWDSSKWSDREDLAATLPGGSVTNTYDFVEVGIHVGRFGLAARVSEPDAGLQAMLVLSLGRAMMDRGFRHPAKARAREGVHYTTEP